MKVAALQMVSAPDVATNLDTARALLREAAQAGAELALLPEYFCLMGHKDSDKLAVREALGDGAIQRCLAGAAREHGLWVVGGTMPLVGSDDAHVLNTSLVYGPDGERVARYDKIHLFKFDNGREQYDESRVIERGAQPVAFDVTSRDGRTWRIGMSVCYDLRFPELYRSLHADVLLVPSAFTYVTGQAHWELLLRARAVENLAFVVAAAQGGVHANGRRTWGHSMVVDPWGVVLQQRAEGAGVVVAELDAQRQHQLRAQLPALEHRIL
ncbi:carbon-nitrogen hydrolase family protein [Caenimonas koreensis DSM 17982]|uniref:Carbon-nitrogen hydrolase family protein n=3 Tax=Caenimonas TaxID=763439 RepID=A0A844AVQ0_9BURK|nr:carbon-nitrogen hydrolase family protein [Caenimonas koreensis]MRD48590.1 carbon-nitrogen hydrolase family protein [Caenimonas koreensis DSM 17982]